MENIQPQFWYLLILFALLYILSSYKILYSLMMAGLTTESCSCFWVLYVNCVFFGLLCIYHSRMSHLKFCLILMVFVLISTEDIRTLNIESTEKADAEQVNNARAVIKKLRFQYTPYRFDNPNLQVHWRNVESLVLDYDERPEVIDDTGNVFFRISWSVPWKL